MVALLFTEDSPGGITLQKLISNIENRIAGNIDLAFKLHHVVAATLGTGLNDAMTMRFDERLAD